MYDLIVISNQVWLWCVLVVVVVVVVIGDLTLKLLKYQRARSISRWMDYSLMHVFDFALRAETWGAWSLPLPCHCRCHCLCHRLCLCRCLCLCPSNCICPVAASAFTMPLPCPLPSPPHKAKGKTRKIFFCFKNLCKGSWIHVPQVTTTFTTNHQRHTRHVPRKTSRR